MQEENIGILFLQGRRRTSQLGQEVQTLYILPNTGHNLDYTFCQILYYNLKHGALCHASLRVIRSHLCMEDYFKDYCNMFKSSSLNFFMPVKGLKFICKFPRVTNLCLKFILISKGLFFLIYAPSP